MVFSSHLFIFYFLPQALLVYYLLPLESSWASIGRIIGGHGVCPRKDPR